MNSSAPLPNSIGGPQRLAVDSPISPSKRLEEVDYNKVDPKVLEAAKGFEGLFLDQLMRVMRQTVPKSEMDLENGATEIYRGMLDSEYSKMAANQGGVGLAEQIVAYLQSRGYTGNQGPNGSRVK